MRGRCGLRWGTGEGRWRGRPAGESGGHCPAHLLRGHPLGGPEGSALENRNLSVTETSRAQLTVELCELPSPPVCSARMFFNKYGATAPCPPWSRTGGRLGLERPGVLVEPLVPRDQRISITSASVLLANLGAVSSKT